MAYLIKNGTIVNEDWSYEADILIDQGVVKEIGKNLSVPLNTKIIDATGKLLLPGGIDTSTRFNFMHPHLKVETCDDFFTGSQAALAGGTTTIMNYIDTQDDLLVETFEKVKSAADADVCCDYSLIVAVKKWSLKTEEEMQQLIRKGINSLTISMIDGEMNNAELLQFFKNCSNLGILPLIHAENKEVILFNQEKLSNKNYGPEGHLFARPEEAEEEAVNRAIVLARNANCPVFIANITSKVAAKAIAVKREKDSMVYGQPVAAALGTDGQHYLHDDWKHAAAYVMSPPLRLDPDTSTHLMQMLSSNILQTTGSNHCPFKISQKQMGIDDFTKIPSGVNGVEERMSIIWEKGVRNGIIDKCQFVAVTSSNAAKFFNIYPRKGRIAIGSDADIVVWDPEGSRIISSEPQHQKVDFNIFEGMHLRGIPTLVFSNGKLAVEDGNVKVDRGSGHFISMEPFSPYVFSRVKLDNFPPPINRPVAESSSIPEESVEKLPVKESYKEFYVRPPTKAGRRNLQDSTFSLSGTQIDENVGRTTRVKVSNPPGGHSTNLW